MQPDTCKKKAPFVDQHGRTVTYLRLSVTDRCDLRCTYCMSEHMKFLPRKDVLSLEEMYRLATVFMDNGTRKIRLTGGEPLVRKEVMKLVECLSYHLDSGELDEVTLTTNGTQLAKHAKTLKALGVKRVNVSLDTLDAERYRKVTRLGEISKVLSAIDAALACGLKIKLNAVSSRGHFEEEVDDLILFANSRGMDITFIEEMPLGVTGVDRWKSYLPTHELKSRLSERWSLTPAEFTTGGPSSYMNVKETGGRIGFIAPMSCNFCGSCNRVRVSCTGRLYTCLGKAGSVDLRDVLRTGEGNQHLESVIREAIHSKPRGHDFQIGRKKVVGIARHMSELGG